MKKRDKKVEWCISVDKWDIMFLVLVVLMFIIL